MSAHSIAAKITTSSGFNSSLAIVIYNFKPKSRSYIQYYLQHSNDSFLRDGLVFHLFICKKYNMSAPTGRRANLLLITLILVASILLEQFFIAPILPWLSNLGSIRPMVVFLDIPLALPTIDLIPVSIIFALFYQVAPSAGLSHEHPSISSGVRVWKALTGWWLVFALLVAGGGIFYLAQDYLPRNISNGIDSFGVRADLTLPYPSGGPIHLHGSVVQLFFTLIGMAILRRRTSTPGEAAEPHTVEHAVVHTAPRPASPVLSTSVVSTTGTLIQTNFLPEASETFAAEHARYQPPANPVQKPAPKQSPAPAQAPAPAMAATAVAPPPAKATATAPPPAPVEKRYQPVTILPGYGKPSTPAPEPAPTCRLTTPPPIAVVMPRAAPGIGKMHPCYVIGGLKPAKNSLSPMGDR